MVSDCLRGQLRWRLVLIVEALSHVVAIRRNEMENAERTNALADELKKRADVGSRSAGLVFGDHVPVSVHAPSIADFVERDQGTEEEGLGVRVHGIHGGNELAIPLRIRERLAAKLRESAGSYWPVEDV